MDVAMLEMCRTKAAVAYEAYRALVKPTENDLTVMDGYRALAEGKKLINAFEAIRKAGLDAAGRPKLAIAMAHWKRCRLEVESWRQRLMFCNHDGAFRQHRGFDRNRVYVPIFERDR